MSEQGLEAIESTTQKTHEWIARIAEAMQMEKRDGWKSLPAVLQTLRDRLPVDAAVIAVHIGGGEMQKVMEFSPPDTQSLFPTLASAA